MNPMAELVQRAKSEALVYVLNRRVNAFLLLLSGVGRERKERGFPPSILGACARVQV
jgi:hypothetical protein